MFKWLEEIWTGVPRELRKCGPKQSVIHKYPGFSIWIHEGLRDSRGRQKTEITILPDKVPVGQPVYRAYHRRTRLKMGPFTEAEHVSVIRLTTVTEADVLQAKKEEDPAMPPYLGSMVFKQDGAGQDEDNV